MPVKHTNGNELTDFHIESPTIEFAEQKEIQNNKIEQDIVNWLIASFRFQERKIRFEKNVYEKQLQRFTYSV